MKAYCSIQSNFKISHSANAWIVIWNAWIISPSSVVHTLKNEFMNSVRKSRVKNPSGRDHPPKETSMDLQSLCNNNILVHNIFTDFY